MATQLIKKQNFDVVFITTYTSDEYINTFLESISVNNKYIRVLVFLLEQNNLNLNVEYYCTEYTDIQVFRIANIIGLSVARNYLLGKLNNRSISFDYIMFPDDDSIFSDDFFINYNYVVDKKTSYLFDVFFVGTKKLYKNNCLLDKELLNVEHFKYAMSVNLMINRLTYECVGFFDEMMGVGSYYGAAEDSDYFLRAIKANAVFAYSKQLFNYHPNFEDKYSAMKLCDLCRRFKGYGMGVAYLYRKHSLYRESVLLLIRAIVGSFLSLFKGNFNLSLVYLYSFYYRLLVVCKLL